MNNIKKYTPILFIILAPIVAFFLFDSFTHNPFSTMEWKVILLNIVFYELWMLFFYFITGSFRWALSIQTCFWGIYGLANYYVYSFRSAPIVPWDILSVKTAASVADNYKYSLGLQTILLLIGFILLLILGQMLPKFKKPKLLFRLSGLLLTALLICLYSFSLQKEKTISFFDLDDKLFTPQDMCETNGTAISFLMDLKYVFVAKPENYHEAETQNLLSSYETADENQNTPNIIVVMDEAFSDLSVLGDFTTNTDYMPFLHSMMNHGENAITGYANVSVLGGNTPNSEFEFLTGNTMGFFPAGSIPYQQYIHHDIPNLTSYLLGLGYDTLAMHPYYGTGWNRNRVYPMLGFQTMEFLDDYENPSYIRDYVSDEACVDHIIQTYETSDHQNPLFIFNVTMQNHSGYLKSADNFDSDVILNETNDMTDDGGNIILNHYLSLIKDSDEALEKLVNYFKTQDEDTVIVFFGDHQPNNRNVSPLLSYYGKDTDHLEAADLANRYKVPFLIWANFDIQEESNVETSLNYLGARVLDAAGMKLPAYFSYLEQLEKEYPVINSIRAEDLSENSIPIDEAKEKLLEYQQLQYYMMFDAKQ